MNFVEAYSLQDLPPGSSRAVRIGGADIALFNVEGTVHALENSCLHAGAALTGGPLCGKVITCRAHGWRYDVTNGALLVIPERRVRKYPVQLEDGKVLVQLDSQF